MPKNRTFFLFFILIFVLAGCSTDIGPGQANKNQKSSRNDNNNVNVAIDDKTYANKDYGYSVKYPGNWQVNEEKVAASKQLTISSPDNLNPVITIAIDNRTIEQLTQINNANGATMEETKVNNIPAYKFTKSSNSNYLALYVPINQQFYAGQFYAITTDKNNGSLVENTINSFTVEKPYVAPVTLTAPQVNQTITSPARVSGEINFTGSVMDQMAFITIKDNNNQVLNPVEGRPEYYTSFKIKPGKTNFEVMAKYATPSVSTGVLQIFVMVPEAKNSLPVNADEEGTTSYTQKLLQEVPVTFGEPLTVMPKDWKTFNDSKAPFTFQYPSDWKITAAPASNNVNVTGSGVYTVSVGKSRSEITVNGRQIQCEEPCWCRSVSGNTISTCSTDKNVSAIFDQIVASFKTVNNNQPAN